LEIAGAISAQSSPIINQEVVMIQAYVLIEAEPARVPDLMKELPNMELDGSVITSVHAVTGRYDLIAFVESPDLQQLGR
jgi:uncharacterized protein with GYD domain